MSYKTKLQTNNDNLEGNNIDLQSILNTINNLPAAGGGTEDLDTEITEQEGLIEQIEAALVGKAAGGVEVPLVTVNCSINTTYPYSYILDLSYLTFEEGKIIEKVTSFDSAENKTIIMLKNSYINMTVVEGEPFVQYSPLFSGTSFTLDSGTNLPIYLQQGEWYSATVYIDENINATISFG